MTDRLDKVLPIYRARRLNPKRLLYTAIIFSYLAILAMSAVAKREQEGPTLKISDALRVGSFHLGQSESSGHESELGKQGTQHYNFVKGKCISGNSSEVLSDGLSALKRGLISKETLLRRLGSPSGTCNVADSEVWIYNFTLTSPLDNGRYVTTQGHLHVFIDSLTLFGLHLNNFELAINGSGLERWPDNDPRLTDGEQNKQTLGTGETLPSGDQSRRVSTHSILYRDRKLVSDAGPALGSLADGQKFRSGFGGASSGYSIGQHQVLAQKRPPWKVPGGRVLVKADP